MAELLRHFSKSSHNAVDKNSSKQRPEIKLNLHGCKAAFSEGKWRGATKATSNGNEMNEQVVIKKLKEEIQQLKEDKNMLQLKNEILIQMLTEETTSAIK